MMSKGIGQMGLKTMHLLSYKYRADPSSVHGCSAVCESGCSPSLLLITSGEHEFSSKGSMFKNACETMALMAEDERTRETFLEAHAANRIVPELYEQYQNEPDVRLVFANLLSKIVVGVQSVHLDTVMADTAWRNKVLEILMGQLTAAQNNGGALLMLLNTLQAFSTAGGDLSADSPEALVCLIRSFVAMHGVTYKKLCMCACINVFTCQIRSFLKYGTTSSGSCRTHPRCMRNSG